MTNQEFWEEQCDRLLDALWTGWEQFYSGHKRPEQKPMFQDTKVCPHYIPSDDWKKL